MAVRTAGEYASWLRYRASAKGKEMLRRVHARKREAFAAWIAPFKAKPCADCGGTFDPVCMDFDHRPGELKKFDISDGVNRARQLVVAELAKCDLVCSNCHRIRTHRGDRNHQQLIDAGRERAASPTLQLSFFDRRAS